ncbi:MAG TPA: Ppx/GppA phosphatase family protein [Terriglobales bacterium]|nr:Ppx/GppA phosphatase family protein [Terriglobales bacterium]
MAIFAAVDIGANSVRLKISRLVRRKLEELHEDREVVRLGESVFSSGMLSPDAIARTVKVLRRFHKATQQFGADAVRVVATSALRDARNAPAFIDWVRMRTGWEVEVISGIEEARLIHLGIVTHLRSRSSKLLLMDLGGGSCELTVSDHGHIRETVSLPLGAVRLTREFLQHDPPLHSEMEELHGYIAEEIGRVARRIVAARPQAVIATSGTAAALAASSRVIAGRKTRNVASTRAVMELASRLARRSAKERAQLPGIGPRRAEIIVAGAAVFAGLMRRCELGGFRYSPLGLRDGLLLQMVADHARSRRAVTPSAQLAADRWDAVLRACERYRVDLQQAQHIRELALQMFRALRRLHALPPEYEEWLGAAAMLSECGAFVNRTGWHRHSHYIIVNTDILGYTPEERHVIGALARYLGAALPSSGDKVVKLLPAAEREHLPKAVALLRLARALNQGRRRAIRSVKARVHDGRVLLQVQARRGGADLEMWGVKKERAYFRAVFGRELEPEVS